MFFLRKKGRGRGRGRTMSCGVLFRFGLRHLSSQFALSPSLPLLYDRRLTASDRLTCMRTPSTLSMMPSRLDGLFFA